MELAIGDFVKLYTARGVFLRRIVDIVVAAYLSTGGVILLYALEDPNRHVEYATRQCIELNEEEEK